MRRLNSTVLGVLGVLRGRVSRGGRDRHAGRGRCTGCDTDTYWNFCKGVLPVKMQKSPSGCQSKAKEYNSVSCTCMPDFGVLYITVNFRFY